MKNFILMTAILLAGFIGINAQSTQSANEGHIGYSYDESTVSHGVTGGYTRYVNGTSAKAGTFGITGEVSALFNDNSTNSVSGQAGIVFKARNFKHVQPSVRALAGVSRNTYSGLRRSDTAPIYTLGGGLDFAFSEGSRYKPYIGVNYVNQERYGVRDGGVGVNLGLVF